MPSSLHSSFKNISLGTPSECEAEGQLFTEYARDFDAALVKFVPHKEDDFCEVVATSAIFDDILTAHGFGGKRVRLRCSKLTTELGHGIGPWNGSLPWVPTLSGRICLHVEVTGACDESQHETDARDLPMALCKVSSLSCDGAICASVVCKEAYLNGLPQNDGAWLWFPLANTELISDELWEQLGCCRSQGKKYPPHLPSSWTSLIEPSCLQSALNNFSVMESSHGEIPYDQRVLYRKMDDKGGRVCLRCSGRPILWSSSGKVLAMVGCHTDVSAENRDDLTKITFIGKISHEIRTPLNAVVGAYEMLSEDLPAGQSSIRDALAMMSSATKQLREVVDDVLDYSALSAGKMPITRTHTRLVDLLNEVLLLHSRNAAAKSINLTLGPIPANMPVNVLVDPARMRQVISNLISNAIKFTDTGGSVSLVVTVLPNQVSSTNLFYAIDVVDTGRGIPRSQWDSIFNDFHQARHGDSCIGSGLGLAICWMLVALHEGRIYVKESNPGAGTTMRVQMATPVELEPIHDETKVTNDHAVADIKSAKSLPKHFEAVLIVDDTETNTMVLTRHLKKLHPTIQILVAENGKDAVKMALHNKVDIVLMDIHMPIMDGIEATKYILARKPDLIVIGQTANTDAELELLCRQIGMKDILLKPTGRSQLAAALGSVLSGLSDATGS